jgi:hypothetical protein
MVDASGTVMTRQSGSFGDICGSCGTGGDPGHDSGYQWTSSGKL